MSLYHIVFIALVFGAVWEHIKGKTPGKYFLFMFFVLAAMLCFRFGQGQDYFSYADIYNSLPANPLEALRNQTIHSEPGWKLLCSPFKLAGLQFPWLVFAVSAYLMVMFFRFLKRYGGERKMLALVLSYHTLYMSYFVSAMRQGMVVATLLGVLLPWLTERRYVRYCIVVLLLSTIHSVSLVLLLLPLFREIRLNVSQLIALVALGFLTGTVLILIDVNEILYSIKPHLYFAEAEISLFAILERIATFAVVTFCYYTYQEGLEPNANDDLLIVYKVYALGIFLYGVLMWSALISSRMAFILKVVEIIVLCISVIRCRKATAMVLCYCLLLSALLYVKNINSYLVQGGYQNASVIDYPFVTVFNQKDILNYRQDVHGYPFQ